MEEEGFHQYRWHMDRCIELALQGTSLTRLKPPYVGAVVLSSDGQVIGEGYRSFLDGTRLLVHAERMVLDAANDQARGGTLVSTLEPCVAPASKKALLKPCVDLILEHGIKKVVIGLQDCSATVRNGVGILYLRKNGVDVQLYEGRGDRIRRELMKV